MKTQLPSAFRPLFNSDYLYYVFYGGRGSGKTENIAQSLIILSLTATLRILCIRESQNSISESVKATLEKWIGLLDLHQHFTITKASIVSKTGSEFIFAGMRSHNAVNVKSISDINITWIEEAEAFSKKSWQLLVPSVIRTENPKIIISFNPNKDDDIIYQTFVSNTPPANSYIKQMTYKDNPFFKGTQLEQVMLDNRERWPKEEFDHVWLGTLVKYSEGSLFKDANLEPLGLALHRFSKIVIACDPATTDNNTSNEYGIVVMGKTAEGLVAIIDDLSDVMSPFEFSQAVLKAKGLYNTNEVIVEVNNGGDFIKALLLEADPFLSIKAVRASTNKMHRALPVSNLFALKKIRLNQSLTKLERQLRLMTDKGYMGNKGESPDRLDAMVWGAYELFGIKDKESVNTIFKADYFEADLSDTQLVETNIVYLTTYKTFVTGVVFNIVRTLTEVKLVFTDAFVYDSYQECEYLNDKNYICFVENTPLNNGCSTMTNVMKFEGLGNNKLDQLALLMLPIVKNKHIIVSTEFKLRHHNGILQNILLTELNEFTYENTDRCQIFYIFACAVCKNFNLRLKEV